MIIKQDISHSLNLILKFLKKWELPVCQLLNEGLTKSEIEKSFQQTELKLIAELIDLYIWRNGTDISEGTLLDDIQLIPGFHFLSLQHAIKNYLVFKEDERWNRSWFPVFANGGGDFYAVDLSHANNNSAPIIGFIIGELEQVVEYESLSTMLMTFSECFRSNVIFKTPEGFLEMDDSKLAKIARQFNPNIDFWLS